MLIFLVRDGKADTVVEQFDWLTAALGLDTFRKLFPVILAKQEVTAHNLLWPGDIHFCNGGNHPVCFAILKYIKPAVKRG